MLDLLGLGLVIPAAVACMAATICANKAAPAGKGPGGPAGPMGSGGGDGGGAGPSAGLPPGRTGANSLKLVFSSSYAGCLLPCLLVLFRGVRFCFGEYL